MSSPFEIDTPCLLFPISSVRCKMHIFSPSLTYNGDITTFGSRQGMKKKQHLRPNTSFRTTGHVLWSNEFTKYLSDHDESDLQRHPTPLSHEGNPYHRLHGRHPHHYLDNFA